MSILFQSQAAVGAPLCCTADLQGKVAIGTQLDGYREAFKELLRAERIEGGFQWVFRLGSPTLAASLTTLAKNEAASQLREGVSVGEMKEQVAQAGLEFAADRSK